MIQSDNYLAALIIIEVQLIDRFTKFINIGELIGSVAVIKIYVAWIESSDVCKSTIYL